MWTPLTLCRCVVCNVLFVIHSHALASFHQVPSVSEFFCELINLQETFTYMFAVILRDKHNNNTFYL